MRRDEIGEKVARHPPLEDSDRGLCAGRRRANPDDRGCLFEIFREEWAGAFKTVQWNACKSRAGVMRGVHVHVDYDEFYTLPLGRVFLALRDIRRTSPTFGSSIGFEWSADDGFAVPVPAGAATPCSS